MFLGNLSNCLGLSELFDLAFLPGGRCGWLWQAQHPRLAGFTTEECFESGEGVDEGCGVVMGVPG